MRQRERLLRERQSMLLLRSASVRDRWVLQAQGFGPALGLLDRGLDGWRWLKANPAWPVGTLVAFLFWRPRRLVGWVGRTVWVWQLWRRMRPVVWPIVGPWVRPWLREGRRLWRGH